MSVTINRHDARFANIYKRQLYLDTVNLKTCTEWKEFLDKLQYR